MIRRETISETLYDEDDYTNSADHLINKRPGRYDRFLHLAESQYRKMFINEYIYMLNISVDLEEGDD